MSFPYHTIPDGSVFYPHHFTIGCLLVGLIVWIVADNHRDTEPVIVTSGLTISLFSFFTLWGTAYPVTGAVGTLLGLTISTIGVFVGRVWSSRGSIQYDLLYRCCVVIGLYVAWDDALEHTFGWPMPLDMVWKVSNAASWLPQIAV